MQSVGNFRHFIMIKHYYKIINPEFAFEHKIKVTILNPICKTASARFFKNCDNIAPFKRASVI